MLSQYHAFLYTWCACISAKKVGLLNISEAACTAHLTSHAYFTTSHMEGGLQGHQLMCFVRFQIQVVAKPQITPVIYVLYYSPFLTPTL